MLKFKNYIFAESIEQAYELNKKRRNQIIGGYGWLKMQNRSIDTAIDISKLELNYIRENEDSFEIGAMTTLRELELHEGLNNMTQGAIKSALKGIVGVQFRNCVTVGGSVYSRFGFSDVCALFLALDASVYLYNIGEVKIADFMEMPYDNNIITHITVPKAQLRMAYESFRVQATDFPILCTAVAKVGTQYRVVMGARPAKAKLAICASAQEAENCVFTYGSNMRASAEYREKLAKALIKRCVKGVDYEN